MAAKKFDTASVLESWVSLNEFLREANEMQCSLLLNEEQKGKRRVQYLLRIHARFNKVRAQRERGELLKGAAA